MIGTDKKEKHRDSDDDKDIAEDKWDMLVNIEKKP